MLRVIPLFAIPFIIYNLVAIGGLGLAASGGDVWMTEVTTISMISGASWVVTWGDLMILCGIIILFVEILKSTGIGNKAIVDHMLSTFVFIAFLVEFLLVKHAAHSVFFTLMLIALVDVIAGFSVSIRGATRDVSLG